MSLEQHYKLFKYNPQMTMEERLGISHKTKFLDLNGMGLTKLPPLDDSLIILWCNDNHLTSLEYLPQSLTILSCSNNPALSIPAGVLPHHLRILTCVECNLATLPALPNELEAFNCDDNQIQVLPDLPQTLKELRCANNRLTSLPRIPASVLTLRVSNNCWSQRFLSHIAGMIIIDDAAYMRKAVRAYHLQCHKLDKGFNKLLLFEETLRTRTSLNDDVISKICSFVSGYNGSFATQADLVSQIIASGELI